MGPIDASGASFIHLYSANGIRTRVWALRGPRPSPLDDSAGTAMTRTTTGNKPFKLCDRPGGNRTPNRRFWRPVLYQLSYGPKPIVASTHGTVKSCNAGPSNRFQGWLTGIEPATPGAPDRCSNQLSYSHH